MLLPLVHEILDSSKFIALHARALICMRVGDQRGAVSQQDTVAVAPLQRAERRAQRAPT